MSGSHVTWRNCRIHDFSNYAIITWNAHHLLVENCNIHGSELEHGIYLSGLGRLHYPDGQPHRQNGPFGAYAIPQPRR